MNADDIQALMGAFLIEAQEFLLILEDQILVLETAQTQKAGEQAVKSLFRAAHSLKGSALMFGLTDLATAAHQLEDSFGVLRDHVPSLVGLDPDLTSALLKGVDILKSLTAQSFQTDPTFIQTSVTFLTELRRDLEHRYEPAPIAATTQASADQGIIQAIFEFELLPLLDQMETHLTQAQPQTLATTQDALLGLQRQLASTASMLNLSNLASLANDWHQLLTLPTLTSEHLQTQGLVLLQALHTLRDQVLSGQTQSDPLPPSTSDPLETLDPFGDVLDDLLGLPSLDPSIPVESPDPVDLPLSRPSPETAQSWQRPTIRVDLQQLNDLINLVGELVINRTNLEQQEKQLQTEARVMRQRIRFLQQTGGSLRQEYDRLTLPQTSSTPAPSPDRSQFDALELDQYSEFHATAQSMIETTQTIDQSATQIDQVALKLESSLDQLRRITAQLRQRVMQLRVVPFSRVVDHLPRAIRDLSRTYNKEANLLLLGRESRIDESLLEALRDPLLHLVRNAFDHGIESPTERQALGKPTSGQIEIEARQQGGQTLITIQDDGRGIDPERIRQKLLQKSMMTPAQVQSLSLNDLYECLFLPGFSTADQVGDLSGRGVGLDIVRSNLQQVRGSIKVESQLGRGTTFTLKLPLMLSIIPALLVEAGSQPLAIPLDAVEEILHIAPSQIQTIGSHSMLEWRDEWIRIVSLPERLHFANATPSDPTAEVPLLILSAGDELVGVQVDRLRGQQEIVIKPIPAPLVKPFGIVGTTILGSGDVVLILDVEEIIGSSLSKPTPTLSALPIRESAPAALQILIVDDAYAIRQLLNRTLTRANYRVVEAKDGQDALDQLRQGLHCDLIITDLEMPRLDGFGLIQALKADPTWQRIPTAVLSSRTTAKHRQLASDLGSDHYFTKPYREDDLLQVISQLLRIPSSAPFALR